MAGICQKRLPETNPGSTHHHHKDAHAVPFKFESQITKDETERKQTRNWLNNSILDNSAFTKCIRSLKNNKSPLQA